MPQPRLVVTVTAESMSVLRARRDAASRAADLVELRLDGVRDIDVAGALADRRMPVIVTCRSQREGGRFDGPEDQRLAFLAEAARGGAEYVDVEWTADFAPLVALRGGKGIVLSSHDFDGVPADLAGRWRAMRAAGVEIVKLAVMARRLGDNLRLLELGAGAEPGSAVLLGMGLPGLPSRVLAGRFGSAWTYSGDGVAPGQLPAERMLTEFRFRQVTSATRVFGVVGNPIGHSLSPAMHNAAFSETGEDAVYLPFEAESADDFLCFARALGVAGASVTAPFKQALASAARYEAGDPAASLGAINTLKASTDGWLGRNADVEGFLAPLDARGIRLDGCRASVVGSGGAARAVAFAMVKRGATVTVHGRDLARAEAAAAVAPGGMATDGPVQAGEWDLLVNATPVGTWPGLDETPVPAGALVGGRWVYDLVYNPRRTRLLADAAAAGCACVPGIEMLVAQAGRQFEWWTGKTAPHGSMRAAAEQRLSATNPVDRAGDR